jgi:hypothetical protein
MSNLLVQNIKHTNDTTAMTISSTGEVEHPQMTIAMFGFTGDKSVSSGTNVNTHWVTMDGDSNLGFKPIGPQPTVSSGIITLPSSGVWEFHLSAVFTSTSDQAYMGKSIEFDVGANGSYESCWAYTQCENFGGTGYTTLHLSTITNVANAGAFAVRSQTDLAAAATLRDKRFTRLIMKKLAPAQS